MVLLPTGKVLAWDLENNSVQVWNPAADTFTDVTNTAVNFNFFCAGQTALADGRVLIDGGHVTWDVGSRAANAFDPVTQTWSALQPMAFERWYPTVITLADGRVLAVAGHTTCKTCVASTPEVYDPVSNTWTPLPGAVSSIPTQYPHLFVLPDGRVVQVSSSEEVIPTAVLDVNAQTWTTVDPRPLDGGSAVMYAPGKVMKAGAAWDDGVGNPATTTYVLDMTQATPSWRQTSGMAFPRLTHNLTLLPDGTVLVTGGSSNPYLSDPASVVYDAELWSPTTETWTPMARMLTPRMYHSTALLLPDGRVLSAGGGRFGGTGPAVDQLSAEVYSPPYLFNGVRPTITSAPATIAYGSTFSVTTPDAAQVAAVSVVRLGSVTHTFDAGQRFLSLNYQQIAGGLSVTAPLNENLAPPGYYMLFILNTNGVPSIAPFVQIR
jgi:galactose oxidase-like protein/Kelch motif protein